MEHVLLIAAAVLLLAAIVFLAGALIYRRSACAFGAHTDRAWNLFGEFMDHMMATTDQEAFWAVTRKRAARKKAAEETAAKTEGSFKMVE